MSGSDCDDHTIITHEENISYPLIIYDSKIDGVLLKFKIDIEINIVKTKEFILNLKHVIKNKFGPCVLLHLDTGFTPINEEGLPWILTLIPNDNKYTLSSNISLGPYKNSQKIIPADSNLMITIYANRHDPSTADDGKHPVFHIVTKTKVSLLDLIENQKKNKLNVLLYEGDLVVGNMSISQIDIISNYKIDQDFTNKLIDTLRFSNKSDVLKMSLERKSKLKNFFYSRFNTDENTKKIQCWANLSRFGEFFLESYLMFDKPECNEEFWLNTIENTIATGSIFTWNKYNSTKNKLSLIDKLSDKELELFIIEMICLLIVPVYYILDHTYKGEEIFPNDTFEDGFLGLADCEDLSFTMIVMFYMLVSYKDFTNATLNRLINIAKKRYMLMCLEQVNAPSLGNSGGVRPGAHMNDIGFKSQFIIKNLEKEGQNFVNERLNENKKDDTPLYIAEGTGLLHPISFNNPNVEAEKFLKKNIPMISLLKRMVYLNNTNFFRQIMSGFDAMDLCDNGSCCGFYFGSNQDSYGKYQYGIPFNDFIKKKDEDLKLIKIPPLSDNELKLSKSISKLIHFPVSFKRINNKPPQTHRHINQNETCSMCETTKIAMEYITSELDKIKYNNYDSKYNVQECKLFIMPYQVYASGSSGQGLFNEFITHIKNLLDNSKSVRVAYIDYMVIDTSDRLKAVMVIFGIYSPNESNIDQKLSDVYEDKKREFMVFDLFDTIQDMYKKGLN